MNVGYAFMYVGYACICVCVHLRVYVCQHSSMHTCTYVCVRVHRCICMYARCVDLCAEWPTFFPQESRGLK